MIARKGSNHYESVSVTETDVTAVRSSEWSLRCTNELFQRFKQW